MNNAVVSIIVPIYNAKEYLEQCLESIRMQTYEGYEVLLIDDGSTDSSREIAEHYVKTDGRFRYFRQDNAGPSAARNKGLDLMSGKFVVFVDSDDWIQKDYIEKYLRCQDENKSDIIIGGYTKDGQKIKNYVTIEPTVEAYIKNLLYGTGGCVWGKIYSARILKSCRFNLEYRMREDLLFGLNLSNVFFADTIISYIDYYGYCYRYSKNSLSASNRGFDCLDKAVLDIVERLDKLNVNEKDISDFLKNIFLWDCVKAANSNQINTVLKCKLLEQNKKKIRLESIKDYVLYGALVFENEGLTKKIYTIYGKYLEGKHNE